MVDGSAWLGSQEHPWEGWAAAGTRGRPGPRESPTTHEWPRVSTGDSADSSTCASIVTCVYAYAAHTQAGVAARRA